mmetsp:Transcript_18601/g.70368  ORF Transcript_18601/g.70368 Transcript_18601/m.70368 type:complete len:218 (+) Transcript_18601:600-1253(+)
MRVSSSKKSTSKPGPFVFWPPRRYASRRPMAVTIRMPGKGIVILPKSRGKRDLRSSTTRWNESATSFAFFALALTITRKPRSLPLPLTKLTAFTKLRLMGSTSWKVTASPRSPRLNVASAASVYSRLHTPPNSHSSGGLPWNPPQPRSGAPVGLKGASASMAAVIVSRSCSMSEETWDLRLATDSAPNRPFLGRFSSVWSAASSAASSSSICLTHAE